MENVNIQECPVLVASVFLTQLVIFFPSQKEAFWRSCFETIKLSDRHNDYEIT